MVGTCGNPFEPKTDGDEHLVRTGVSQTVDLNINLTQPLASTTPPAAPAYCVINSFTASVYKIRKNRNESSTLNWITTCPQVVIDNGIGQRPGVSSAVSPVIVSPFRTTTYQLSTINQNAFVTIKVTTWFGRNAVWVVPVGLAVIGGGIALLAGGNDNGRVHDTEIQAPTGGGGVPGEGNPGTWSLDLKRNMGNPSLAPLRPNMAGANGLLVAPRAKGFNFGFVFGLR